MPAFHPSSRDSAAQCLRISSAGEVSVAVEIEFSNLVQPSLQLGLVFVVECGENPLVVL
jgi:hypothetical protein